MMSTEQLAELIYESWREYRHKSPDIWLNTENQRVEWVELGDAAYAWPLSDTHAARLKWNRLPGNVQSIWRHVAEKIASVLASTGSPS
jgi:hypothetical protein